MLYSFLSNTFKKEKKELTEQDIQEIIVKKIENYFNNSEILKIVIKNEGIIHGPCIRDIILNIKPDNINIIINYDNYKSLLQDLKNIGYNENYNNPYIDYKTFLIKDKKMDIEIITDTDHSNNKPDFDIDVLTYDGSIIYNWIDDLWQVSEVYKKILKKEARPIGTYYPYNIKDKGFKLILK